MLKEYKTPFKPATVYLFKNNSRIDSNTLKFGSLVYTNLDSGDYRIVFNAIGMPTARMENIYVPKRQLLRIEIKSEGPCIYTYPEGHIPICPQNHTDKIIPIKYGLLVTVIKKGSPQSENIHPGGCIVTGCDPMFYCKIHKLEF